MILEIETIKTLSLFRSQTLIVAISICTSVDMSNVGVTLAIIFNDRGLTMGEFFGLVYRTKPLCFSGYTSRRISVEALFFTFHVSRLYVQLNRHIASSRAIVSQSLNSEATEVSVLSAIYWITSWSRCSPYIWTN